MHNYKHSTIPVPFSCVLFPVELTNITKSTYF